MLQKRLSISTLSEALQSERFINACKNPARPSQLTSSYTQAAMAEMIRIFPPANVLEIGTFFADTAYYLVETMADIGSGHLTTIDPYGGDRVPGIIETWPDAFKEYVTFRPDNSMTFFATLEGSRTPMGNNAPFDVVFIDGNHTFDYALFDVMRSSLYLRPGGALVVDNVEQAGPHQAVLAFKQRRTHWKLFKIASAEEDDLLVDFMPGTNAAVLLAPIGIEIGMDPYKYVLYNISQSEISKIMINAVNGSVGLLRVTTNLYTIPADYQTSGTGVHTSVGTATVAVQSIGDVACVVTYDPPLRIFPDSSDDPVAAEIELSFFPAGTGRNLLLRADEPVSVAPRHFAIAALADPAGGIGQRDT